MSSISVHERKLLSFPNTNNLFLLEWNKDEKLCRCNYTIRLCAIGIYFVNIFYINWSILGLILDQLVDQYFGLIGADIECVFKYLQSGYGLFEYYGLGNSMTGGMFLNVVL